MSNTLSVKVSTRKTGDQNWYEGTVSIAGLKPTKLARRSDGSTQFPTKSALSGAARNLAKALGFSDVDVADPVSATSSPAKSSKKPQIKSAAKKSVASSSSSKATAAKKTSKKSSTTKKTAAKKSVTTTASSKKPSTAASKPTQAK